jgi:Flp pilus assembly protein TadG
MRAHRRFAHGSRGQALAEFSIAIGVFLMLLIGAVDLGRAVYLYNGVSEAAREISRATSVHPGSTLGGSPESQEAVNIQQGIIPGLSAPTYACVDIMGAPVTGVCKPGNWVRVSVFANYHPALPVLAVFGPLTLTSASSAEIQ